MESLSMAHWIIVFSVFFVLYKAFRSVFGGNGKISEAGNMVCPACGTRGEPKQITRGSTGIELVLWLCFIIPGLIYSLWRLSTRHPGCPSCGAAMIGTDTPNGKSLLQRQHPA